MNLYVLAGFLLAFAITAAIGPFVIKWLRTMKIGQKILEIGPKWHMNKQNIPTMGGIMFITGILLATVIAAALTGMWSEMAPAASVMGLALANGLIGVFDDWKKIKKKQNAGLTAKQKMLLQIAVAALFITLMRVGGFITPSLTIPFVNITITIPWVLYILFMTFVIVGTVNAVNLTDGLDGLAAGVTLPVAVFFCAAALFLKDAMRADSMLIVSILSAALAGGLIGFLIFNFNPAKVFMGDTGSLYLGGMICGLAFAIDLPLILIPVGLIYICETLSVILQVGYFKLTHGKRIFKMTPIHHHFEMCGYTEKQIVITAFLITALLCALSYWGVLHLYL